MFMNCKLGTFFCLFSLNFCKNTEVFAQKVPKFCETKHFDGIWNYGIHLQLIWRQSQSHRWIWTYDQLSQTFGEPPVLEATEGVTTLTSFYVSKVPKCETKSQFCESIKRAQNMLFVKQKNFEEGVEQTQIYRFSDQNSTKVNDQDYPWGLNYFTKEYIWPTEWRFSKFRPSAYWPSKYKVLFIIYSGFNHRSALLWNDISSIDWYKNMNESNLNSDVPFVGMFHLNDKIFAIGDQRQKKNKESFVYLIQEGINSLNIIPYNISVRQFFGCAKSTPFRISEEVFDRSLSNETFNVSNNSTIDDSTNSTANVSTNSELITEETEYLVLTTNDTQESIHTKQSKGLSPILVTAIVLFVIIFTVLLITVIFQCFKSKGTTKSTVTITNVKPNKGHPIPHTKANVL